MENSSVEALGIAFYFVEWLIYGYISGILMQFALKKFLKASFKGMDKVKGGYATDAARMMDAWIKAQKNRRGL